MNFLSISLEIREKLKSLLQISKHNLRKKDNCYKKLRMKLTDFILKFIVL